MSRSGTTLFVANIEDASMMLLAKKICWMVTRVGGCNRPAVIASSQEAQRGVVLCSLEAQRGIATGWLFIKIVFTRRLLLETPRGVRQTDASGVLSLCNGPKRVPVASMHPLNLRLGVAETQHLLAPPLSCFIILQVYLLL